MRRPLISLLWLALVLAPGIVRAQTSLAILGLEVESSGNTMDLDAVQLAKDLSEALRAEARRNTEAYKLAPNSSRSLAEMKLLSGCEAEGVSCMAGIGEALGAEALLYGSLEVVPAGARISLQLLDVASKKRIRGVVQVVPRSGWSDLSPWARTLYARAIGAAVEGAVTVSANASTGRVRVDDGPAAPLSGGSATISGLSEGRHRVSVESPGYRRWDGEVTVRSGDTARLAVELEAIRSTAQPTPMRDDEGGGSTAAKVGFWASLGVATAAGAFQLVNWFVLREGAIEDKDNAWTALQSGGCTNNAECQAIANAAGVQIENDQRVPIGDICDPAKSVLSQTAAPSADLRKLVDACKTGDRTAVLSYTAGGVAIVAGAAAVVFFYKGYLSDDDDGERQAIRVAPTITPTTAGVGLTIDF